MKDLTSSIGLPDNYWPIYIKLPPGSNSIESLVSEYTGIMTFLSNISTDNTITEFQGNTKQIKFINYGDTQLVFVITINDYKQYTLIVNQPITPFGVGKTEYDNLKTLSNKNDNVIKPMYYRTYDNRELYITPYYHQARCLGITENSWGMWVPEPVYHFKIFSSEEKSVIISCMVALLINLYDEKNKKGLSGIRLDGGDFMLEKGFEDYDLNFENVLKRMKLIAARSLVQIDLDEYINVIRQELSRQVLDEQKLMIIGKSLGSPIALDTIENGIRLGIDLRKKHREDTLHL